MCFRVFLCCCTVDVWKWWMCKVLVFSPHTCCSETETLCPNSLRFKSTINKMKMPNLRCFPTSFLSFSLIQHMWYVDVLVLMCVKQLNKKTKKTVQNSFQNSPSFFRFPFASPYFLFVCALLFSPCNLTQLVPDGIFVSCMRI